jgi:hypothetical protein
MLPPGGRIWQLIIPHCASSSIALALARSINYDHTVNCKLKHTFTIVNHDRSTFIELATGPNVVKLLTAVIYYFFVLNYSSENSQKYFASLLNDTMTILLIILTTMT